jgi:hypothetical protein
MADTRESASVALRANSIFYRQVSAVDEYLNAIAEKGKDARTGN